MIIPNGCNLSDDHPPENFREGHPPHHYPMPGGGRGWKGAGCVGVVKGGELHS